MHKLQFMAPTRHSFKTVHSGGIHVLNLTTEALEVEPEHITELLQSHVKTFNEQGITSYGQAKKVVSWNRRML